MSGKLYSLNTRCYSSVLQMVSANYANHHNNLAMTGKGDKYHSSLIAQPLRPFDAARAVSFTHALVKNIVTSYLAHTATDSQTDVIAELLFGEGTKLTPAISSFVDDFLTVEEIDNLFIDIDQQVAHILKRDTWNIVDTFDMGSTISIVVREDLRIKEWKQMKGYVGKYSPTLDLDLSEMISYLRSTTNRILKPIIVTRVMENDPTLKVNIQEFKINVGDRLDFKPMILEILVKRYPFLRLESQLGACVETTVTGNPKNIELLVAAGLRNSGDISSANGSDLVTVNDFIDKLLAPVVESYALHHFLKRLDNTQRYEVCINSEEHLTVTLDEDVQLIVPSQDLRMKELAESYLRGDYLPPKDRDAAERYIQENQLQ